MDAKRLEKYRWRLFHRLPLIGGWVQRRAVRALEADGSPAALRVLADVLAVGRDEAARAQARQVLGRLDSRACIDTVAAAWADTRHPELERLLCERGLLPGGPPRVRLLAGLKLGRRDLLLELSPRDTPDLVAALEDSDAAVAGQADLLSGELADSQSRAALAERVCVRWAETRSARLEAVVVRDRLVASESLPARVLSALKTGQGELLWDLDAGGVEALARACTDADPVISEAGQRALRALRQPEAQDAVCQLFLERDDPSARAAALEAGYLPRDEARRALFLFLTEQWDRYEALDFERRLLVAAHEAADAGLRRRILDRLRAAGRTDYLTVLAGSDYRSRAGRLTAEEAEVLVRMLTANREWARLWGLVFELPLTAGVGIVQTLTRQDWRPARDDDRMAFEQLAALAAGGLAAGEELRRHLPPAVLRARARVPGRVNDLAFSPRRPLLAVGTGRRRLVLWDYQRGERVESLGGFNHSVGHVAFAGDDILLCAERTSTGARGRLHVWQGGERFFLPQEGPVTMVEPATGPCVLLTQRDNRVLLLDAAARRVVQDASYDSWCRAARVAPDGAHAVLLREGVTLVGLPRLNVLAEAPGSGWVASCAAFVDDAFVAGRHTGQVLVYRRQGEQLVRDRRPLHDHKAAVQGAEYLARYGVVLTAGANGVLAFTAWGGGGAAGRVRVEGERLTSLHVSPGGEFMAVGDSDSSISLWDLRVLELPALLARPLARALPSHLAAVNALLTAGPLPAGVGRLLRFAQCALQHRFRYDVEVDEVPAIRPGEFDIEIA